MSDVLLIQLRDKNIFINDIGFYLRKIWEMQEKRNTSLCLLFINGGVLFRIY